MIRGLRNSERKDIKVGKNRVNVSNFHFDEFLKSLLMIKNYSSMRYRSSRQAEERAETVVADESGK